MTNDEGTGMDDTKQALQQELSAVLETEILLAEAQQEMVQLATDANLQGLLQEHVEGTKEHQDRVVAVLTHLGLEQTGGCATAEALIGETRANIDQANNPAATDLAIAAGLLKGEALEVETYTVVIGMLTALGHDDQARLLSTNRDQDQYVHDMTEGNLPALATAAMPEG